MIFMTRYYLNLLQYNRTISVLKLSIKIFIPAFLLTAAIIISSCEENATIISTGLLPGSDFVNIRSTDKIGVDIYTQYVDSVETGHLTYSYLGKLSDPYFGTVRTDFVSQLRLTQKWPGGGAFTIDSVKLYLYILGAKGTLGTDVFQEIEIAEIGEMLNSATSYYSNRDPDTIKNLGTYRLPVITKDTTQTIQIAIATEVGQYLMRDTTRLTQEIDSLDFRSFFKGIYVTLKESPQPFLVAIPFNSANMFIRVFYHNVNTNNLTFDFIINANSIRYNRYFHDFTTAPPETRIQHINDGFKDTLSYIQAFNGVFPKIKIPGLAAFRDSLPISVNRAKMTISVFLDNSIYTKTTVPSLIYLMYKTADSQIVIVPDYLVSPSFFDGSFNSNALTYTFNIASFAQQYFEGKIPNPEIQMQFPEGEFKSAILRTNANTVPVKFDFTYIRF